MFLAAFLNASYIKWNWDYEKALLLAKKQNKNLMLYLQKKDCMDCQKMLKNTFLNKLNIKKINESYISVILTFEDKNDYPIELFYASEFPTLFFISSEDESFLREPVSGFVSSDKLNIILYK